jgi:hypothetical protein
MTPRISALWQGFFTELRLVKIGRFKQSEIADHHGRFDH